MQQAYEVDECRLVVWLLADTLTGPVVTRKLVAFTISKAMASCLLFHHISHSHLISLCFSLPFTTPAEFTHRFQSGLSLSALDNSDHLSISGCGNSHLFLFPSLLPYYLSLIWNLSFSHPPTPPLPGENPLNLGSECSTTSHKKKKRPIPSSLVLSLFAQRQSSSVTQANENISSQVSEPISLKVKYMRIGHLEVTLPANRDISSPV